MAKQKTRGKQLPDLSKQDPLIPIDLASIGASNDPCFGKGYDLSTRECKQCGDSELCALKMSQVLGKTRKELEKENKYKDLDVLEDVDGIKKFMRRLKRKGEKRRAIVLQAAEKFEVPTTMLRKIYKELKQ